MTCRACGAEPRPGAKFCPECGGALPRSCASCGAEVLATAKFCDSCGSRLAAPVPVSAPATREGAQPSSEPGPVHEGAPVTEPELRQATIMFCDLANSTTLSATLDPEDLRDVLRRYQAVAGAVIEGHGGLVSAYLGDGILVQFGYPVAEEDDPERAVRAGLEVVRAVRALQAGHGLSLDVRVGIATGLTVVGDLIGSGASRESAVVGRTPNLAARLQGLASPGDVVISDGTHRLIGALFDAIDLGPLQLKGFVEPERAWRVVGERRVDSRFDARHAGDELGPLLGRDVEYQALLQGWRSAQTGKGRVITVSGEAGLGKSRLVEALCEAAKEVPHVTLRYHCSARFQHTALHPIVRHMERAAHIEADDPESEKLDKLEALLSQATPSSEMAATVPYIAALLSIPTGERYPPLVDSPERQRDLMLKALVAQVLGLARQQPVLLVVEDLHWVDPTTLALVDLAVRASPDAPVLVVGTGRPEFSPPWSGLPRALTLALSRLDADDRLAMIRHVAKGKALPSEIVDHILRKSDGIPLFVEELTKALTESGVLQEEEDRFVLTGPMKQLSVPSTLHDSLLARLDRLSTVKEVAQLGAIVGREFSYEIVAELSTMTEGELRAALARLAEADLIQQRGTAPNVTYTFKHALIQDAAYATMLRGRRQSLHAKVAQILMRDAAADREPELVAHHLVQGGLVREAVPYLQKAGMRAAARAAHVEACTLFNEGLAHIAELPADATRDALELGLCVHLGMSLAATRGYAAPEVEQTNQRARELARAMGDTEELFWVLRGLCALYVVRDDARASRELAEQLTRIAEETQRPEFLIEAYLMWGHVLIYAGALREGSEAMEKAVEHYAAHDGASLTFPTPQDPTVAALSLLASTTLIMGDAERAHAWSRQGLAAAQRTQRPFDLAYANCHAAQLHNLHRRPAEGAAFAGACLEVAQRHGFGVWIAAGAMNLGVAQAALGAAEEAIALIGGTLPLWRGGGAELNVCYFLSGLALAHRTAGRLDEALALVDQALEQTQRLGERYLDAELLRLRGELLLERDGDIAPARAEFERALATAREQGAQLFELRTTVSLARALSARGGRAEAHETLRDALERLELVGDFADRDEATTLLAELSA